MLNFFEKIFNKDSEKFNIPRSTQDIIPIKALWNDGVFLTGKNQYSKTFKFEDINYAVASKEDKEEMFLKYSDVLNSFDTGSIVKITINNKKINKQDFKKKILMDMKNDKLDKFRKEYNEMLISQSKDSNDIVQERLVTITTFKNSVQEARVYFNRVGSDLINKFNQLGSKCVELDTTERLRILHDFYQVGTEDTFSFNLTEEMKKGHNFKDSICPDSFDFKKDYFKIGSRYGRVLFLKNYANFIKDSMTTEFTELNKNMMLSIDIIPVPMDKAVKEAENRALGIETNIAEYYKKATANNNFYAEPPYDLKKQREEAKEFLDDLVSRDQRMFLAILTIAITDDTKEELENDTETIKQIARKGMCDIGVLDFQQVPGLNLTLPIRSNLNEIKAIRTLTTESLAVLNPFKVQEIRHTNGIYYGQNVISKNMIIADRKQLLNGNSFTLGVSGSGKSFAAKEEITNIKLREPNSDIIIIDPENEYANLVKALGGEVINLSSTSENHINALDINKDYGEGSDPIKLKQEFMLSLCEQVIGDDNIGPKEKSIIDRCTQKVYKLYQQGDYKGVPPTLQDFREELLKQNEEEAKEIALAIELFTDGSLNTFAFNTNVNTKNSLLCYNIIDLGKELQGIGMLVILDSILNRITSNRAKNKHTYIFIDEIYLLFQHQYSADFLFRLWKRVRKYGAFATGITQNVEDLLQSNTAREMLANSEFLIILNQAATDRLELAKLLNMSDLQLSYITNVGVGEGLIKVGSNLVPFANRFPKNTELYKLMSTKPNENFDEEDIVKKII